MRKQILMIPGPTPVPQEVLNRLSYQMINHRGSEFEKLFDELQDGLKYVFQTDGEIIIFPAAGTGGMEAAIVNFINNKDKVLCISVGVFGNRFYEIAKAYNVDVELLEFEWGTSATEDVIAKKLKEKKYEVVLLTHNETSTGVINDIEKISKLCKQYNCFIIVDAISSLAACELYQDKWQIDVVVAGSQKALMLPPGLTFVSIRKEAIDRINNANLPRYYFDIPAYLKLLQKNQTPYTPALPQLFGLTESLKMLKEYTLEKNFKRHIIMREAVRESAKKLNLKLLATDECASPTVTAIYSPDGIDADKIRKLMREGFNVVIAEGQQKLKGKIFRIGHLGYMANSDVITCISALEASLEKLGHKFTPGEGVAACLRLLTKE